MIVNGKAWNPRFVAYAAASGIGPQEALDRDRVQFPGGCMTGFVLLMSGRWQEWDRNHGHSRDHVRNQAEYAAFDAWLQNGPSNAIVTSGAPSV
jgi:hypothetical protein